MSLPTLLLATLHWAALAALLRTAHPLPRPGRAAADLPPSSRTWLAAQRARVRGPDRPITDQGI